MTTAGITQRGPADLDEAQPTPVDGVDVVDALSPSRIGDFTTCPLLYRFRRIDKIPEPPSPDAVRGTVVHRVLEQLFDLPPADRTPQRAAEMIDTAWAELQELEPALATMFPQNGPQIAGWLVSCREVLARYFELEDPRRLEPADRELYVETLTDTKLLLRGVVDRVDVAPDGAIRVVDYKGLAVDTPLPTSTGWTTMGAVRVGDQLIGSDGQPTTVTKKSGVHHRPCYRVTFRDGSSVVCDNVHLWPIVISERQREIRRVISADELYRLHTMAVKEGRPRSMWIDAACALDIPPADDLPVDPWLLGAWLGDGKTTSGEITVGHADLPDMITLLKERWPGDVVVHEGTRANQVALSKVADQCTYGHSKFKPPTAGHPTRRCVNESDHARMVQTNRPLSSLLRQVGALGRKHIPRDYLRAGVSQRIELLRGLMDTDGWWSKKRHRAGFTTTNDELAANVVELLRSLGIHPQHFVKPYSNPTRPGRNWHIVEFTPYGFNPFALPRKAVLADACTTPLQERLSRRRILASVVPTDSVPTQCISVDAADSLYLCGEGMVPTHNTGNSPGEMFEGKALFQLKFYALVIWRTRGVIPKRLQLIYLGDGQVLTYDPDEADLVATERKVQAVWEAIRAATEKGEFVARKGSLCAWCSHQALCPEFGGTPPPIPTASIEADA